jgi:hypothetical protein
MPAFWNQISMWVPSTNHFTFDPAPPGGAVSKTLDAGNLFWDGLLSDFRVKCQATLATFRIGLTDRGHVIMDDSAANNFDITWTDTNLRNLLGFTGPLGGQSSYTAPRRIRAALYLEHQATSGVTNATLREHDPKPSLPLVSQTVALSGVSRTTTCGTQLDQADFELQMLDNSARLVSPSGADGTTYAAAAGADDGLTMYRHAMDFWYDSTSLANQGWSDGRPVRYFADSSDASNSLSAAIWTPAATTYTTWVVGEKACREWPGVKVRPPKSTLYNVALDARQYVSP